MPKGTFKVNQFSGHLALLSNICDTGFTIAAQIRFTRPTLLFVTYDRKWIERYNEAGYLFSDPVVAWGMTHLGAIRWNALKEQDIAGVLSDARRQGLRNGWTYATGNDAARSIASFSRSTAFSAENVALISSIIDDIHAMTEGFDQFTPQTQAALRALCV